jgi:Pectinacetylesterase
VNLFFRSDRRRFGSVFLTLSPLLCSITAFAARNWQSIIIPDAYCGNGQPYNIFLEKKDSNELAIEFMGGGACWDKSSCYGPMVKTSIYPLPFVPPVGAFNSDDSAKSPLSESTYVYLPYCTGDVFSGTRVQKLNESLNVFKVGRTNVEKTFTYLRDANIVQFSEVQKLRLVGSSAGAIGSLLNAKFIDSFVPQSAQKSLLADSPGLHFGPQFWTQLGEHFKTDLFKHLEVYGVQARDQDTTVAKFIPQICKELVGWNVGFLQASRDIVMSSFFGTTTPKEHEARVFGEDGLWKATQGIEDHCAAWIPSTEMHMFLLADFTARWKVSGVSALEFATGIFENRPMKNYSDRYLNSEVSKD